MDDEADLLLTLGDLLRVKGYNVLVASDASHALKQIEQKVSLIILDINLAGEDGLQLMDFLKANRPQVPIILYTGMSHDDDQVKSFLERGASSYVSKGEPVASLLFAIEQLQRRPSDSNSKS